MTDEDPHYACSIGGCPSITEFCSYSASCPSATEHGDGVIVVGTIAAGLAQQVRRADGRLISETIAPHETAVLVPAAVVSELPEMVRLRERVAKLEARLEIDREFVMGDDGVMVGVEIAAEDRDKASDGIECRDATIRLQDEHIVKLKARIEELEKALEPFQGNDICEAIAAQNYPDATPMDVHATLGDFRRARAALSQGKETT